MTREEFKKMWEADETGLGITFDDIADVAKKWGLFDYPKCYDINIVRYEVLKEAKCIDAEDFNPYKVFDEFVDEDTESTDPKSPWKDAQGEDLPVYDREVIVLIQDYPNDPTHLRVAYGHRPKPDGYVTSKGEKIYPMTYGKGGWNGDNVKYWLDLELPING